MEMFARGTLFVVLCYLSSCSTLQVATEYDRKTSYNNLTDYTWLPEPTMPKNNRHIDNKILDEQIRASVDKNLRRKGFQLNTASKASFQIGYHVAIDQKTSINTVNRYYGYEPAWNPNAWPGTTDLGQHNFEQGTIILDIVDSSTNELVWRANASAEIDPFASSQTRLKRIDNAITKMLSAFPPKK